MDAARSNSVSHGFHEYAPFTRACGCVVPCILPCTHAYLREFHQLYFTYLTSPTVDQQQPLAKLCCKCLRMRSTTQTEPTAAQLLGMRGEPARKLYYSC